MSEAEPIGPIVQSILNQLRIQDSPSTAMGPAAAQPSEGARPAGVAEDTQPAGRGPIEAVGSEPPGELATVGRSVDAIAANQSDDLSFARAILPLLIQSARYAGYIESSSHELEYQIKVLLIHPDRGSLIVTLGRCRSHQYNPNRHRWTIPNRPSWRRSFCHLQDKLFNGCVPGWLRPGCTSCGRVVP